jgi:hypothetical protein
MSDFNACLVAEADEDGILATLAERIKESVEAMEIDVEKVSARFTADYASFSVNRALSRGTEKSRNARSLSGTWRWLG